MKLSSICSMGLVLLAVVTEAHPTIKLSDMLKKRTHNEIEQVFARRDAASNSSSTCAFSVPDPAIAPKANIWGQLSDEEANSINILLTEQYNLTAYANATLYDNFVLWIETLRPNKTDVLEYLDFDGDVPQRYAKAIMFFGGEDFYDPEHPDGYWQTFQVGPLPISNATVVQPLTWLNAKNKVDYQVGYQDTLRNNNYYSLVKSVFMDPSVRPVVEDITKSPTYGLDNSTLGIYLADPTVYEKDTNTLGAWSAVFGSSDYQSKDILSKGLYFFANVTGRDPSKYTVTSWFYGNKYYESTGAFVAAYESGEMEILPQVNSTEWTNPSYVSGGRDLDEKQTPMQIEIEGRRWRFSEEERYFTWMDWEFYIAWDRDHGMTLYDVKFKGERILYELGLQEAIAEYAGDDPYQMSTCFLDSTYGFGNEAWGMIPGYDCPYNAEYFNVSWHSLGLNSAQNNSYCAYEFVEDYPISRHTSSTFVTVNKNPTFVLRSVTTIGNYDYNFSYKFFLDGTIEVSVRAAGFIQGSYYVDEFSSNFGYKIGETLAGSFHDHVLNFKADFDIAGVENQVRKVEFVQAKQNFTWAPGKEVYVKKKVGTIIETEDDSKLTWPANGAGAVLVESYNETNAWGAPKAYRIVPNASPVHRLVNQSLVVVNQAQWADYDVCFTKQKDSEPFSSNLFNAHDVYDPTVQFNKFFDGESLEGEDIVAWINLGLHHLPNTQDVPITIFNTAQSSFVLTPYNYFDKAQITDLKSQMEYLYASKDGSEPAEWDFYGTELDSCDYQIDPLSFDAFSYGGLDVTKDVTNSPSP